MSRQKKAKGSPHYSARRRATQALSRKAVVLLSGGLDSATVLYLAQARGFHLHALVFDYGQRHRRELMAAQALCRRLSCPLTKVSLTLPWQGSSLLDKDQPLPMDRQRIPKEIPSTYVPARNLIFLSFAASCAEAIGARDIFIGANAIDFSGYPDCRPAFYQALEQVFRTGLKSGVEGRPLKIHTPLLRKSKAAIVRLGVRLGVPFELTWSCYAGGRRPCGRCDSCLLRAKGFAQAKMTDPLLA